MGQGQAGWGKKGREQMKGRHSGERAHWKTKGKEGEMEESSSKCGIHITLLECTLCRGVLITYIVQNKEGTTLTLPYNHAARPHPVQCSSSRVPVPPLCLQVVAQS